MWLILFLILPLAGLAYISWHVWMLLPLSVVWKCIIILLGVACFVSLFLVFGGVIDKLPIPLSRVLYKIGTSSVIVLLYMVILFLLLYLGRVVQLVPRAWLYENWVTTAAIMLFMFVLLLCGNIHYKNKVRVNLEITTSKPIAKDYTFVMISDLHLGYHNTREDLSHWVDMINSEHPDYVFIAGDVIDISVRPLLEDDMAAEFRRIEAPVYACLGNHEYYSKSQLARKFYNDADIHLLCDSATVIDSTLVVIGRDDRSNQHRKTIKQLVEKIPAQNYIILLDHQPYDLNLAEEAGVDFQFSGHTHQGQIWPVSWITNALYECSWGAYQRGKTQYYVTSGLGIWGGKFRIGTQSEYVVVTLKSNK